MFRRKGQLTILKYQQLIIRTGDSGTSCNHCIRKSHHYISGRIYSCGKMTLSPMALGKDSTSRWSVQVPVESSLLANVALVEQRLPLIEGASPSTHKLGICSVIHPYQSVVSVQCGRYVALKECALPMSTELNVAPFIMQPANMEMTPHVLYREMIVYLWCISIPETGGIVHN